LHRKKKASLSLLRTLRNVRNGNVFHANSTRTSNVAKKLSEKLFYTELGKFFYPDEI